MPDSLPPEMVFQSLTLQLAGQGYPGSQDPIRYFGASPFGLAVWPPEESVVPGFHFSEKVWMNDEEEPDWPAPTFLDTINLNGVTFDSFARYEVTKLTIGEEEIETSTRRRFKWRFAWLVPAAETAWRFVHLRHKMRQWYTVSTDPGPVEVSEGETVEFWWKGVVPEGYDPEDPLTYPGTPWVEVPLPAAPVTPADATAANYVRFEWVWPKPNWVEEHPNKVAGAFQYPGFIPGTIGPIGEQAKPVVTPPPPPPPP
jgi:hypothetical protein